MCRAHAFCLTTFSDLSVAECDWYQVNFVQDRLPERPLQSEDVVACAALFKEVTL
jgi:hypothetical protein